MPSDVIVDVAQLRRLYRSPGARAANKVVDHLDEASMRFIARCPLVMLATANGEGRCDVSPRGGPPGFVTVVDRHHVALPDFAGNNRLDSAENIIETGQAGLLFCVPGKPETVRINGKAWLTTQADILDRSPAQLRRPKTAIVVKTQEVFAHCAQSFRRSGVWDPGTWAALADAPDLAEIYSHQLGGRVEDYREALRRAYEQGRQADMPDGPGGAGKAAGP